MSWTEWLMVLLGIMIMFAIWAVFWNDVRGNDRTADACAIMAFAFMCLFFMCLFFLAQNKAEREHLLKHAAEHRAVQESVESMQSF